MDFYVLYLTRCDVTKSATVSFTKSSPNNQINLVQKNNKRREHSGHILLCMACVLSVAVPVMGLLKLEQQVPNNGFISVSLPASESHTLSLRSHSRTS